MYEQNHYDILGVSQHVDDAELRVAYRRLAMQYHPDRNKNSKEAEANFKNVQLAYDCLSKTETRATFDQYLKAIGRYEPRSAPRPTSTSNRAKSAQTSQKSTLRRLRSTRWLLLSMGSVFLLLILLAVMNFLKMTSLMGS